MYGSHSNPPLSLYHAGDQKNSNNNQPFFVLFAWSVFLNEGVVLKSVKLPS